MEKKRVNLYLSGEVKQELDLKIKKYGMSYGNYFTYLILQEKEKEDQRERQYRDLSKKAKIWG